MFVAESSESFRAADREQFYASASRFKQSLATYTDDKHELLEAVRKSSHRPSATDLVGQKVLESTEYVTDETPMPSDAAEATPKVVTKMSRRIQLLRQAVCQTHARGVRM